MFPVFGGAIFYKSNRLLYRTNFASRLLARLTFFSCVPASGSAKLDRLESA
jgi:hypothetical protein